MINKCVDCGKILINNRAKRCGSCASKYRWTNKQYKENRSGFNSSSWKTGLPKCIDCGEKLSNYRAKRCRSCNSKFLWQNKEYRNNLSGKNNSNWKGGWENNFPKCIDCGIQLKNYHAKRCQRCWSKFSIGINSPAWKDGKSLEIYPSEFNDALKLKIRKRDDYICQNCGMTEEEHLIVYGKRLGVHHIDYDKQNCQEDNLTTLCSGCNIRANFNRKYWVEFFMKKNTTMRTLKKKQ